MISINSNTDLLLIVDMQDDFITGSLAVTGAAEIVPIINQYIKKFSWKVLSKDMHPEGHCSFVEQGGPWPIHCPADGEGSKLHADLDIDERAVTHKSSVTVHKGTEPDKDAYSAFDGTHLIDIMESWGITRVFICGLATDYCVKATVLDALNLDFLVYLLADAIRAVNIKPGDGIAARHEMFAAKPVGAIPITLGELM